MTWGDRYPASWALSTLESLVEPASPIIYGILQPGPEQASGVPYVRPTEIVDGTISTADVRRTTPEIAARYARSTLAPGDVLLSIVGTIGKVAFVPVELAGANITQSSVRIRVDRTTTESRWIAYGLRSPAMRTQFDRMMLGTGVPRLNVAHVRETEMPLAPINEQRRIVEKLDAVFDKTRAAKARLERLPALLDKLKRSILAAAFRGDLTEDWRAAHPDVEPASVLLERIRAERRHRWEDGLRAKGKDPKKAPYEEPAPVDVDSLPALPEGWAWTSLGMLSDRITKGSSPNWQGFEYAAQGIPFVRSQNVGWGDLRLDELAFVDKAFNEKEPRSILVAGDVLVNIVGASIGRVAIATEAVAGGNTNQAVAIIRPSDVGLGPYIRDVLLSAPLQDRIHSEKVDVARANFSLGDAERLPVPLAPLRERLVIGARLQDCLAAIARQSATIQGAALSLARTERAALAKAFRGELVPQDPSDEPASVLLGRIRAARAAEPQRARRGRAASAPEPPRASPVAARSTNGNGAEAAEGAPVDLVVAAFQVGQRLTASAIGNTTGLDAAAVKKALKALVDGGQVRVEGKARGTAYVWAGG